MKELIKKYGLYSLKNYEALGKAEQKAARWSTVYAPITNTYHMLIHWCLLIVCGLWAALQFST
jgi:hypothetical protein